MSYWYQLHGPRGGDLARAPVRPMIATPAYKGLAPAYVHSLLASMHALNAAGMPASWWCLAEYCHVDDAQNMLVREFLQTDCTDLVIVGADQGWEGHELVQLLRYDRDMVGAVPPLRSGEEKYPVYHLPEHKDEIAIEPDGLIEVLMIGSGFLRIRRSAVERLYEAAEKHHYEWDQPGDMPVGVLFERTLSDGVRWGGDLTLCRKWRALGGRIYLAPEMTQQHVEVSLRTGHYGQFLRRTNNVILPATVRLIGEGRETADVLEEARRAWDNPQWALPVPVLLACIEAVRSSDGPILECGSGLSTIVLAAAAQHHADNQPVVALEHDPVWAARTAQALDALGLHNAKVLHVPLVPCGDGGFEWYDVRGQALSVQCGVLVVDGPPRSSTRGGRRGALEIGAKHLRPGAAVIADDVNDPAELALLEEWSLRRGLTWKAIQRDGAHFAVGRLPATTRGSAA